MSFKTRKVLAYDCWQEILFLRYFQRAAVFVKIQLKC